MVCNLVDLDECVQRSVLERFDHQNLNTLTEFADCVPTTENLADVIYNILKQSFHAAHLEKVRIEETMMNSFEYSGGGEPHRWQNGTKMKELMESCNDIDQRQPGRPDARAAGAPGRGSGARRPGEDAGALRQGVSNT